MRKMLSLALIMSLIGSAVLAAQQNSPADGPIARSITQEAARFTTVQDPQPVDAAWSRVLKVAPGTELIVTVGGSELSPRYFVAGDESYLTVLNVSLPDLPSAPKAVLREVASTHPGYFPAAQRGDRFLLEKSVRMGPDGVFVADRKVADLAQVIEAYGRQDIAEIETVRNGSNPVACAVAGYYQGALVGALPGILIGAAAGKAAGSDTRAALLGMTVGWSIGGVAMYGRCTHRLEKSIYPAQ